MAPVLDGVALESLGESAEQKDITYLSGRTGQPPQRVAALVVGHKLAARAGVPAEVMYGLARIGAVTNLSSLLAQGPLVLRRVIDAGISGGFIPGRFAERTEELLASFRKAAAQLALAPSPVPGRSSL